MLFCLPGVLLLILDKTCLEYGAEAALGTVEGPLPRVELQGVEQVFLSSVALLTVRTWEGTLTCMQGVEASGSQKHTKVVLHSRIPVVPAPLKACWYLARHQHSCVQCFL